MTIRYESRRALPRMVLPYAFLKFITNARLQKKNIMRIQSFGTPGIIGIAVSVTSLRKNPTRDVQLYPDVDKRASES